MTRPRREAFPQDLDRRPHFLRGLTPGRHFLRDPAAWHSPVRPGIPVAAHCSRDEEPGAISGKTVDRTMRSKPFLQNLKDYVGFTDRSTPAPAVVPRDGGAPLRRASSTTSTRPSKPIPGARAAITGGDAQIQRLKKTLIQWLDTLLQGPHDEEYFERRARIGRDPRRHRPAPGVHVHRHGSDPRAPARPWCATRWDRPPAAGRAGGGHQPDPRHRARDHARDLSRGPGAEEPHRRAAGDHRPVRGQHRPRAAQSPGRDGVVGLPAARAPGLDAPTSPRCASTWIASRSR